MSRLSRKKQGWSLHRNIWAELSGRAIRTWWNISIISPLLANRFKTVWSGVNRSISPQRKLLSCGRSRYIQDNLLGLLLHELDTVDPLHEQSRCRTLYVELLCQRSIHQCRIGATIQKSEGFFGLWFTWMYQSVMLLFTAFDATRWRFTGLLSLRI